jgi:hypothetical protein
MRSIRAVSLAALTTALAIIFGCHSTHPTNVSDLGSTQVAALSVTSWNDYRALLSPKFDLTAQGALAEAVPDTRALESAILDAFRAQGAVRLAPNEVLLPGFGTPTAPAGSPEGAPATEPGVTAAGAAPPASSLTTGSARIAPEALPTSASAKSLQGDAFLRYMAATALFQEVKLLERYVMDAVEHQGYESVIVRLQITNQPFSDQHPYDTYANLAFFCDPVAPEVAHIETNGFKAVPAVPEPRLPIVIPLLVTDQVEAALLAGRTEELRELALTLAAAFAGIGGQASLEKIDQAIQRTAGRSYRSLFTVGRLADNMLRIRIAARTIPDASNKPGGFGYETMARNHFVTVLVLVPRDDAVARVNGEQTVYLATRYEYRDPKSGRPFGVGRNVQGDSDALKHRIFDRIANGGYDQISAQLHHRTTGPQDAHRLATLAQGNEYQPFLDKAREVADTHTDPKTNQNPIDSTARRLYMDLNVAKLGTNFDSTKFQVRMPTNTEPTFGAAQVYMIDNGEFTEAVIDGVSRIDPARVTATWKDVQPSVPESKVTLGSTSAELRGTSQLVVRFPSLMKLKVLGAGDRLVSKGSVVLTHSNPKVETQPRTVISHLTPGKPVDAPSITIDRSVGAVALGADGSPGTLTLALGLNDAAEAAASDPKKRYIIRFDGVEAKTSEKAVIAPLEDGKLGFSALKSGAATFTLTNLRPGSKFKVHITAPAGALPHPSIEFEVAAPPAAAK